VRLAPYAGPAKGANGAVPWSAPAGVAFNKATGSLLVTNPALVAGLVDPKLFVDFDVYVNDRAVPLERPALPTWCPRPKGSEIEPTVGAAPGRGRRPGVPAFLVITAICVAVDAGSVVGREPALGVS
jgi:hypothetical protein